MSTKMQIVLEGLPERVQETADVLDRAFPGLMTWHHSAELGRNNAVRLKGKAAERTADFRRLLFLANQIPASGKKRTLSSAADGVAFGASLSKSCCHRCAVSKGATVLLLTDEF